jgi:hypothetical protein
MSVEVAIFLEIQVIHYRIAVVQINHSQPQTERGGMAIMHENHDRMKAHAYRLRLLFLPRLGISDTRALHVQNIQTSFNPRPTNTTDDSQITSE